MKNNIPDILLIYTGGTIGMVKDYKSNALKPFDFENIKVKIPELKLLDCRIETTAFSNPIDSSDMSPQNWVKIAEIIESNDAKILSLYISSPDESMKLEVILKVNRTDLTSIIHTFERFNYNIKASFMAEEEMDSLYNSRFESFMKYLNI